MVTSLSFIGKERPPRGMGYSVVPALRILNLAGLSQVLPKNLQTWTEHSYHPVKKPDVLGNSGKEDKKLAS